MRWIVFALLALSIDRFLYGPEPAHKPHARVEHLFEMLPEGYSRAQIKALADLTERELARWPARKAKVSQAARAVQMAKADPHPELDDWLTHITQKGNRP